MIYLKCVWKPWFEVFFWWTEVNLVVCFWKKSTGFKDIFFKGSTFDYSHFCVQLLAYRNILWVRKQLPHANVLRKFAFSQLDQEKKLRSVIINLWLLYKKTITWIYMAWFMYIMYIPHVLRIRKVKTIFISSRHLSKKSGQGTCLQLQRSVVQTQPETP